MIREGIIPIIAGTAVTLTGAAMKGAEMTRERSRNKDLTPMIGAGLVGFGLAHLVLGTIDLTQHHHHRRY